MRAADAGRLAHMQQLNLVNAYEKNLPYDRIALLSLDSFNSLRL